MSPRQWRIALLAGCLLYLPTSMALTQLSLNINEISGVSWHLHNLRITLADLQNPSNTLALQADRLELPAPFGNVRLFDVRCPRFILQNQQLHCTEGRVTVKLGDVAVPPFAFRFSITPQQSEMQLTGLAIAKGLVSLNATEQNGYWHSTIDARNVVLAELQKLLKLAQVSVKNGTVSATLKLDGKQVALVNASLKMQLNDATLQAREGRYALEKVNLDAYVNVQPVAEAWLWQSHLAFKKGAVYADPIYLAAGKRALELDSIGQFSPAQQQCQLDYFQVLHPAVATLNGSATLALSEQRWLKAAQLNVQALDLKPLTTIYNSPFWVGTAFEGVTLAGQLHAKLDIREQALSALQLDVEHLALLDPKQRFGLTDAQASLAWAKQADFSQSATLQWQQLQVYALPLGPAKLHLGIKATALDLQKPVHIGLLGGDFAINQFVWQARPQQSPELHFAGALHNVSLAQLTTALDWVPLSGTLNGAIPGVNYHNNRLDLEGALKAQIFNGEISIEQLAVANLLSDVPKFYSDITVERLDLKQLTGQFKFGSIEGLLSGKIRDLYLENWQPIRFYAWLGTPEDDTTRHRISQKAVDNIANIGGGGATDLISRGVLGVFDSFGYEQLGLGCYLHAGVCQLMGVAPAKNGYTIVKGGGLPRIDVIGYNPRVDWQVLVQRLGRISQPNDRVIK
jgi:hypothetical protein